MPTNNEPVVEPSHAIQFDPLEIQLRTFYNEVSALSSKKPDGPINKFKLKYINQTLDHINKVLGEEYVPFPDFKLFDETEMPTASDVVMMLAQYLKSMVRFHRDHVYIEKDTRAWIWRTAGPERLKASAPD